MPEVGRAGGGGVTNGARAPLVIGLPVRNGERYLEQALTSVLQQTYDDFVVLIADNASTDATEEICRSIATDDPRVYYERSPIDIGALPNFNAVFRRSCELFDPRLFKWVAHDDVCQPEFLERCVKLLDQDPSLVLACSEAVSIDSEGYRRIQGRGAPASAPRATAPTPVERFRDILQNEVWCSPIFGVIRRDVLAATPLLRYGLSPDKVLLAHLSLMGRFAYVDEPLLLRRIHDTQYTSMPSPQKARWVGGRRWTIAQPLRAVEGYARAVRSAPLSTGERRRAYWAIASLLLNTDKFNKLIRPGPYHYFGWRSRRAVDPYAHLDFRRGELLAPWPQADADNDEA